MAEVPIQYRFIFQLSFRRLACIFQAYAFYSCFYLKVDQQEHQPTETFTMVEVLLYGEGII